MNTNDSSKKALVVVDIQNDYFPGGRWALSHVEDAAAQAARVIERFRDRGDLVVHIRHEFKDDNAPFFRPGSEGAQIHESAKNRPEEPVVLKHYINSFRETELKSILDQHGINEIVVVGNMSHMCVDGMTRASVDFGYTTTVLHDACATLDLEFNGVKVPAEHVHAAFMAALSFGYAPVISTSEYLNR
ncbi:Peroxyureidoacrylate/ureidoacrylate amidohydrolase RutB [Pseudomonas fluorescens]|jgi:nicotinamidase-related amidase|uniref:Peroxyureidoacrylate/ureidoacrylate amidohydrolase RutB n=1 Tax=Pseudomonas fluorescens TaxID=294 RepID=A0A5E6WV94_PSEFL|nr:cysteine hydrolase family protein [Pseudomonas fluorescens]VVN33108.1 Peroxyureidoacrylate/ureidoacrylate amidohydrolase RutB [Pseudomonas fluorescens]